MRFLAAIISAFLFLIAPQLVAAEEVITSTRTTTSTVTMTIIHSINSDDSSSSSSPTSVAASISSGFPTSSGWTNSTQGSPTVTTPNPTAEPTDNAAANLPLGYSSALLAGSLALLFGAAL